MSYARFALVGRAGRLEQVYLESSNASIQWMYKNGIKAVLAGDTLQVWEVAQNGDLLRYDAKRTRRLTDKIVAARSK